MANYVRTDTAVISKTGGVLVQIGDYETRVIVA